VDVAAKAAKRAKAADARRPAPAQVAAPAAEVFRVVVDCSSGEAARGLLAKLRSGGFAARQVRATKVASVGVRSTREEFEELVSNLKQDRRDVESDPEMSARDRVPIAVALGAALRHLARVRGEGELTARVVMASPHFRRGLQVVVDAIRPHKEAFAAAHAALRALEEAT
jgi:hypothetical protein